MSTHRGSTDGLRQLEQYVEKHPVGMVVAALGAGYLLSGALFSQATVRILGLGLRTGLRFGTPSLLRAAFSGNAPFNPGNGKPSAPQKESR